MENKKIEQKTEKNRSRPTISTGIVRIVRYILIFGIVLPASTLPVTWQHSLIIVCTATFTLLNLFSRLQDRKENSSVHALTNIGLLNAICVLGATSTGGIGSEFFFLLYVLIVVSSFTLEVPALVVQCLVMAGIFSIQGFSAQSHDLADIVIKVLSLLSFTPLLILLSSRFRKEEQSEERSTLLQQLLKTYEEEDQTILDTITAGVCILDHELRVEDLSESASRMLGLDLETTRGKQFSEIATIGHREHPDIEIGKALLLSTLYERQTTTKQFCQLKSTAGRPFAIRLHVAPILGEADHVVGILLVFEDAECTRVFEKRHGRHE